MSYTITKQNKLGDEDLGLRYDCGDTTTDGQDLASKEEKDSLNKPLN